MNYRIEMIDVKAQPALVIKGKVKVEEIANAIGEILGKVESYLTQKQSGPSGAPFTRTFEFENGMMEFEAGFPVKAGLTGQGEIIATELPQAKVASTIHVGSQELSVQAYEALQAWMKEHGKKEGGAPWETYLSDPTTTSEAQSKMQIFFPVQ